MSAVTPSTRTSPRAGSRSPGKGWGGGAVTGPAVRPSSAASVGRRVRGTQVPQFLCNAKEEEAILPRPLPPGMAYVANYTTFDELLDKQILVQEEEEKVHLSVSEVSGLYNAKCKDQGLTPNRKRESRFIQLLSQNCRGMHFSLRENGLGVNSAECVASILADNSHFAILDLSGNRLKDHGASKIAELLLVNDALVHVALKSNDIGSPGAERLAEALEQNNTITSLDLSGLSGINRNHLGSVGARAMGRALGANETLSILNLGANGLGNEGLSLMISGLECNETLTELDLGSNNLGWEGCALLGPLLGKCGITSLNLERNDIRDRGITILAQAMKSSDVAADKLQGLNLSYNGIKASGFRWLSAVIRSDRTLKSLRLDGNECGETGHELAMAIKENRSLQTLTLSRCDLNSEQGVAVGTALSAQTTISRLELHDNTLGDDGVGAIMKALHTNKALTYLDLSNTKIGDRGGNAIAGMLKNNNSLRQLHMRQNNVKGAGDNVAEALRGNSSLLALDFAYNDFSYKSFTSVGVCLLKNQKNWKREATPRLMTQIDSLKVDEARLHGAQEDIVQEIKRREVTQATLAQKKEHIRQQVAQYGRSLKRLEEEVNEVAMQRAKDEEAMAQKSDELAREKQKQENIRRKIENKIKSEEEKTARIKKETAKIELEIKAYVERSEQEFAPQHAERKAATEEQAKAKDETKTLAEELSKMELRVKELERKVGKDSEAKSPSAPQSRPGTASQRPGSRRQSTASRSSKSKGQGRK
eukprot:TRINITY_DN2226_c0_g1_i1.p1 TRINITY_DN2226_c0_g1~~TRINITY_DN2226_c0_g1_i1.p1  ORF type:complete len:815 (+),score=320.07 TRINITY_DN2226_c0_g1_i1:159-2447(+)